MGENSGCFTNWLSPVLGFGQGFARQKVFCCGYILLVHKHYIVFQVLQNMGAILEAAGASYNNGKLSFLCYNAITSLECLKRFELGKKPCLFVCCRKIHFFLHLF